MTSMNSCPKVAVSRHTYFRFDGKAIFTIFKYAIRDFLSNNGLSSSLHVTALLANFYKCDE